MALGTFAIPDPVNEPVRAYVPGSEDRAAIKAELARQSATEVEIRPRIGGEAVTTGRLTDVVMPHRHAHVVARFHKCGEPEVQAAIRAARDARAPWAALPFEERAAIFLRAADLLSGRRRDRVNAATMLGQSKTVHQAEIDAAAELTDFWRFNVHYLAQIMEQQPYSPPGQWNRLEYRPLDGFVFAVTPFNFTSIGGNLPTAPAICGNTVLWKPASTQTLAAHVVMEVLEEAGLPPGVINFLPGSGPDVGEPALASPELAGVHFTGSTATFRHIWRTVGANIDHYRQYPRLVGETGGKDFVVAHASADPAALTTALLRGAYEYQGQKCSAVSRAYVPDSLWPGVRDALYAEAEAMPVGDVADFRNFMGAVIDEAAYAKITRYLAQARGQTGAAVREVVGGEASDREGWFVRPAVIVTEDPHSATMCEEIFGPVLTVYVYPERRYDETLELCDQTSPYGLTGAVFARDRAAVARATAALRHAAGNFYVNDKPTGAVVGQQPFGGARASGTNDKAGSALNLQRWLSPRSIKENLDPPRKYRYAFMDAE